MEFVDWRVAQRVGELVAGTPPFGAISSERVEPMAHDFAVRVAAYSGLRPPAELPRLELVDRSAWIAANLRTMRPLLGRLSERAGIEPPRGLFGNPLRSATGLLMGAQVGALTGVLSQRVLGQYDLALLDSTVPPRLLLLAPNLAQAARTLQLDRDELVLWVTIHEITHAVQFSGAPWLREHLAGMITELIDGLQVSVDSGGGGMAPQAPRHRGPAGAGRAGTAGGAAAAHARRGPLAAGRADPGDDVAGRGTRRAHDGRDRRRAAAVAGPAAGGDELAAARTGACRGGCSSACSGSS